MDYAGAALERRRGRPGTWGSISQHLVVGGGTCGLREREWEEITGGR